MTNGGRLTLSAGVPYLNSDIIAQTLVSYSPVSGDQIATPGGSVSFLSGPTDQCGLSLNLAGSPSSWEVGAIYDLGVVIISDTPVLCASPKWTDTHTRSVPIAFRNGVRVNSTGMTARRSSGALSVDEHDWTYLGTMQIDATAGQISAHVSLGQARKWGIWNAYNQAPIILKAGQSDKHPFNPYWGPTNFGPTANNPDNCLTVLTGLAQSPIELVYDQSMWADYGFTADGLASAQIFNAIAWDRTTFPCAQCDTVGTWGCIDGEKWDSVALPAHLALGCTQTARAVVMPQIGSSRATMLERFAFATTPPSGGNDGRFYSGTMNMLLTARWTG